MKVIPAHLAVSMSELRILDVPLGEGKEQKYYSKKGIEQIHMLEQLYTDLCISIGQFGVVFKAHLVRSNSESHVQHSTVAVKTLKGNLK